MRDPLLHGDAGAGAALPPARLLHRTDRLPLEGQVGERGAEDPGGGRHTPGQAARGDGRALHVPQHAGEQAAAAYQGLPHREISHLPAEILYLPGDNCTRRPCLFIYFVAVDRFFVTKDGGFCDKGRMMFAEFVTLTACFDCSVTSPAPSPSPWR